MRRCDWLDGPHGPIPAVGVPSASGAPARITTIPPATISIAIDGAPGAWRCDDGGARLGAGGMASARSNGRRCSCDRSTCGSCDASDHRALANRRSAARATARTRKSAQSCASRMRRRRPRRAPAHRCVQRSSSSASARSRSMMRRATYWSSPRPSRRISSIPPAPCGRSGCPARSDRCRLSRPIADMGDGVDPQPRRVAAADAAVEKLDLRRDFGEQRIERLVEQFEPRELGVAQIDDDARCARPTSMRALRNASFSGPGCRGCGSLRCGLALSVPTCELI